MPRKNFAPQLQPTDRVGADITSLFDVAPEEHARISDAPAELAAPVKESGVSTEAVEAAPWRRKPRGEHPPRHLTPAETPTASAPRDSAEAGYVPIFTYLGSETESRMHRAAYGRGGESFKSEIVREALDQARNTLAQVDDEQRGKLLAEIRRTEADDPSRTSRIYRITPEHKAWLHSLAGAERVPMAATVRWGITTWLESLEPDAQEGSVG